MEAFPSLCCIPLLGDTRRRSRYCPSVKHSSANQEGHKDGMRLSGDELFPSRA